MAEKKEQGGENGSDKSEKGKKRTKGGTNEKEKEAGEEKTGRRREAAGSHGTLERDAGQSKRFLKKNNNTLEGAIREVGWRGAPEWSSAELPSTHIWSSWEQELFPKPSMKSAVRNRRRLVLRRNYGKIPWRLERPQLKQNILLARGHLPTWHHSFPDEPLKRFPEGNQMVVDANSETLKTSGVF